MFDRIVCVLVSFYPWGHFVMLIITNLNLISVQPWTYLLAWLRPCVNAPANNTASHFNNEKNDSRVSPVFISMGLRNCGPWNRPVPLWTPWSTKIQRRVLQQKTIAMLIFRHVSKGPSTNLVDRWVPTALCWPKRHLVRTKRVLKT